MNSRNTPGALDTVLHGLQAVQPPEDLHRDVRCHLQRHLAAQASHLRPQPWHARLRMLWGWRGTLAVGSTACVAAVLLGVAVLLGMAIAGWLRPAAKSTLQGAAEPIVSSWATAHTPQASRQASSKGQIQPGSAYRARLAAQPSDGLQLPRTQLASDAARPVRMSRAKLVSGPAPPEPLTEQERLLLLIVRQQDSKSLEILDPELREARMTQERNDFLKLSRGE